MDANKNTPNNEGEKFSSPETQAADLNTALSCRTRIRELIEFLLRDPSDKKRKSRSFPNTPVPKVKAILKRTQECDTAQDFYKMLNLGDKEITDVISKVYDELKTTLSLLDEYNLSGREIFDMLDEKSAKSSSDYDKAVFQSVIKMSQKDREYEKIATRAYFDRKYGLLNLSEKDKEDDKIQSEENYSKSLKDEGYSNEEIQYLLESSQQIKNASKKAKFVDETRSEIAPTAQQSAKGFDRAEVLRQEILDDVDNRYFDWMGYYLWRLHSMQKSLQETRSLVITPYVARIIEEVKNSEENTKKPAFIKGDLGCGKTEVALHVGREHNKENRDGILQRYQKAMHYKVISRAELEDAFNNLSSDEKRALAESLVKNEQKYIRPIVKLKKEEAIQYVLNDRELLFNAYRKKRIDEEKLVDEEMALEPIVLSGHKEFDPAQLIGGFEIAAEHPNMSKLIKGYKKGLNDLMKAEGLTDAQKAELKDLYGQGLVKVGITTKAYLGKLFQAMLLGTTLIIDEVNAIPHEILILLNFYITRKPGNTIQPPINNLPSFQIAEGFKIIFTGNVPKEGQSGYTGRQVLDAAFLSRLNKVPMDYLPNCSEPDSFMDEGGKIQLPYIPGDSSFEEKKRRYFAELDNKHKAAIRHGGEVEIEEGKKRLYHGMENNELYHVLSIFGLPRSKVANLPENYFEKLFQLARISRIIQDAYGDKQVDEKYYGMMNAKPLSFLKNAVPSMRDLLTVINAWKSDGYARDIDFYLWKYFIQDKEGTEQKWVYILFHDFGGFFMDEKVFPKKDNIEKLTLAGSIPKDPQVPAEKPKLKIFGQQEILEKLFGHPPKMEENDKAILDSSPDTKKPDLEKLKRELINRINAQIVEMEGFIEGFENDILKKYCKDYCKFN